MAKTAQATTHAQARMDAGTHPEIKRSEHTHTRMHGRPRACARAHAPTLMQTPTLQPSYSHARPVN
eukprot:6055876-Pleurochrysis_carterae.AAC.2